MKLHISAAARVAATLLAAFICFGWQPIAQADGACELALANSSRKEVVYKPSANQNWLSTIPLTVIPWVSLHQHLERARERAAFMQTEADRDGAGQSLTGESISNPTSCHGVVVDSGNKVYVETDFTASGEMPLTLVRGYNKATGLSIFGSKWSSSFDYRAQFSEVSRSCIEPEEDFILPEEC